MTDAIAVIHQSGLKLPKSIQKTVLTMEKWRVRNWKHHPYDPGWEDGRYCICHPEFRKANTRHQGEIIVDCINAGSTQDRGYLVRSYFEIKTIEPCSFSRTGGRDLLFTDYYFCDLDPPLYLRIKTGPLGTHLSETQYNELINHLSYKKYQVSRQGPSSIAQGDWTRMLSAREASMELLEKRRLSLATQPPSNSPQ